MFVYCHVLGLGGQNSLVLLFSLVLVLDVLLVGLFLFFRADFRADLQADLRADLQADLRTDLWVDLRADLQNATEILPHPGLVLGILPNPKVHRRYGLDCDDLHFHTLLEGGRLGGGDKATQLILLLHSSTGPGAGGHVDDLALAVGLRGHVDELAVGLRGHVDDLLVLLYAGARPGGDVDGGLPHPFDLGYLLVGLLLSAGGGGASAGQVNQMTHFFFSLKLEY